jgi:energy-coupling factor transport system ATP-binding protein
VAFGLKVRGWAESDVSARVETMLADFGLSALAKANPFTLSYGEKRRLSVAAMLVLEPRILVLDEPTFGQDRQNTEMLMTKLVELNRSGRTILIITHDTRLVAEYCDRVAVLESGMVAYEGGVESLFRDQELLRRGGLDVPPLIDLTRRLWRFDPTFPEVVTVGQMVEELNARARTVVNEHVSSFVGATSQPNKEKS